MKFSQIITIRILYFRIKSKKKLIFLISNFIISRGLHKLNNLKKMKIVSTQTYNLRIVSRFSNWIRGLFALKKDWNNF